MTDHLSCPEDLEFTVNATEDGWLDAVTALLSRFGYVKLTAGLPKMDWLGAEQAIERLRNHLMAEVGVEQMAEATRQGLTELRMPFVLEPFFFRFLEIPSLLNVLEATLGESAILRFQNVLRTEPPRDIAAAPVTYNLHQNFKFHLANAHNRAIFVEAAIPIGDEPLVFDVILGSHSRADTPTEEDVRMHGRTFVWQAGDMIIFDPFVWHRERPSESGRPTLSVFQQFCRPFIKPHADYCRAIAPDIMSSLPPRTQRLLGTHARLPTSIKEFYVPEQERPYRSGQW